MRPTSNKTPLDPTPRLTHIARGVGIVLGAIFAASAHAGTVSGGSISMSTTGDGVQQIGTLSKFDPRLGTLNAVTLAYGYSFTSSDTITAIRTSSGVFSDTSLIGYSSSDAAISAVFDSTVNQIYQTTAAFPVALIATGSTRSYFLAAGSSESYESGGTRSSAATVSAVDDLAAFYAANGSTVFDVDGQTLTRLLLSQSGGNASGSTLATSQTSFSVSYDYSPGTFVPTTTTVPEPSSWALAGVGLCAIGGLARRRRRPVALEGHSADAGPPVSAA